MAKVQVTVTYNRPVPGGKVHVVVEPKVAKVNMGDEVQFTRNGIPGRMRITFKEPQLVSRGVLDGDGSIAVAVKLSARTTYRCELFDNAGNSLGSADGDEGGAFEPGGN
jgi:hypothetical protein